MPGTRPNYDSFYLRHLQAVNGDLASYRNQRFIGRGGNGTTFFVTCTSGGNFGFNFALKVFHRVSDDERRRRFIEEIRFYRTLSHPSIVRIHDEGTFSTQQTTYPFAVIDYVPENLESRAGRGATRIHRYQALAYVMNVASAVQYLHGLEHPIVHRDIKPANILVSGPTARLGDLGLAKVMMGEGNEHLDDVRAYVAMPRFYRTPELVAFAIDGKTPVTPASDIYQLGLVLYQLLTGFNAQRPPPPGDGLGPIELDLRDIQGTQGQELTGLISRMLDHEPARRPAAEQVLTDLTSIHAEVCRAHYEVTGVMG